ncbi:hypothetical protein V0288_01465 [Pannus brasiliensis CCIBt3594]|uniref:Nuclear transport factor 2 n=1 Tax=Pannus brasiliensis CCIBt3594 TaxID=1427578 RepID=A0AAW9QKX6_9CHRO
MAYTIASAPESCPHPIGKLDHPIVLRYLESINLGNFSEAVRLFDPRGALQPPFEIPIVGQTSILAYLREEYRDVELIPERYSSAVGSNGRLQITVFGKARIPWFGSKADIDQIWRFFLLPNGSISLLSIETLLEPEKTAG